MVLIKKNETNPAARYRRRDKKIYILIYVARLTNKYAEISTPDNTNNQKKRSHDRSTI